MKKILFIALAVFSLGIYAQNGNPNKVEELSNLKSKEILRMIGTDDEVKFLKIREVIYSVNKEVANNPGLSQARKQVLHDNLEYKLREALSPKEADVIFSNKEFVKSLITE
ncbi:MAG: hypothetical protein Q4B43_02270 [Bacteroidota bacterium]|nr:hypothetical protein [Bacteroidota bacterium]